jgi:predicted GNAT family acetyltransferase
MRMLVVNDAPERSRYEALDGGRLVGTVDYAHHDGVVLLPHAEVDPSVGSQGVGTEMVRAALDDLRSKGATIVPLCSFVRRIVADDATYRSMVTG